MKRAERGYLSRYITGWLDLRSLKMLDYGALARLLIAYIDDARAVDDEEALRFSSRQLIFANGARGRGRTISTTKTVPAKCRSEN
jgi:hypothetical protein